MDKISIQNRFLDLFSKALSQAHESYYGVDWWKNSELNYPELYQNHPQQRALKSYLARYDERVFCYELYHQLRLLVEKDVLFSHLRLQGELNKMQIHDLEQVFKVADLGQKYVPDFLLHSPGDFTHQEIVIEVKSSPKVSFSDIQKDFEKLEKFITNYHYAMGIFLVINNPESRIRRLLSDNQQWIMDKLPNRSNIVLLLRKIVILNLLCAI